MSFNKPILRFVDNETSVGACGRYLKFFRFQDGPGTHIRMQSWGNTAISVFTANKTRVFAFSLHGLDPTIYVHSWPDMKQLARLDGATPTPIWAVH